MTAVGIQLPARANPGIPCGISVNLSEPIVSDPAVRQQAILLAINRPELVGAVYTSETKPATSVLASSTPSYEDESALLGFDPVKAASVLGADGSAPGPDGIRTKGGQALTIRLTWFANAGTNRPALELIQQQLKAVGIDLQLDERPITDATPVQQSGNFVATWGNLTRADPDILRSQLCSATTPCRSSSSPPCWASPPMSTASASTPPHVSSSTTPGRPRSPS